MDLAGGLVPTAASIDLPVVPGTISGGKGYGDIECIRLSFNGVGGLDGDIDNVKLTQVPEPATLALMGLGLAGIGYKRHRSKKAA